MSQDHRELGATYVSRREIGGSDCHIDRLQFRRATARAVSSEAGGKAMSSMHERRGMRRRAIAGTWSNVFERMTTCFNLKDPYCET